MKLTIFGASGKTGSLLVEQTLDAVDEVVVYVRNTAKLDLSNEHMRMIHGGLENEDKIEGAVKEADAVLSVSGPKGDSTGKSLNHRMKNIIAAMKKQRIRRMITISTLSIRDHKDLPEFRARFLVDLVRFMMRAACEDVVGAANVICESDRDWTILRLSLLDNNPKSGKVRSGYLRKSEVGTWISRADVADFVFKQAKDKRYLQQAPAISN